MSAPAERPVQTEALHVGASESQAALRTPLQNVGSTQSRSPSMQAFGSDMGQAIGDVPLGAMALGPTPPTTHAFPIPLQRGATNSEDAAPNHLPLGVRPPALPIQDPSPTPRPSRAAPSRTSARATPRIQQPQPAAAPRTTQPGTSGRTCSCVDGGRAKWCSRGRSGTGQTSQTPGEAPPTDAKRKRQRPRQHARPTPHGHPQPPRPTRTQASPRAAECQTPPHAPATPAPAVPLSQAATDQHKVPCKAQPEIAQDQQHQPKRTPARAPQPARPDPPAQHPAAAPSRPPPASRHNPPSICAGNCSHGNQRHHRRNGPIHSMIPREGPRSRRQPPSEATNDARPARPRYRPSTTTTITPPRQGSASPDCRSHSHRATHQVRRTQLRPQRLHQKTTPESATREPRQKGPGRAPAPPVLPPARTTAPQDPRPAQDTHINTPKPSRRPPPHTARNEPGAPPQNHGETPARIRRRIRHPQQGRPRDPPAAGPQADKHGSSATADGQTAAKPQAQQKVPEPHNTHPPDVTRHAFVPRPRFLPEISSRVSLMHGFGPSAMKTSVGHPFRGSRCCFSGVYVEPKARWSCFETSLSRAVRLPEAMSTILCRRETLNGSKDTMPCSSLAQGP